MDEQAFKQRTKAIALRVIKLVEALPASSTSDVIGRQLLRSATSVGANYRAVCRAKSSADMINKLRIVEEEADESGYWLELIGESGLMPRERLSELLKEFDEITAMVVASQKTIRANNPKSQTENPKSIR
ncbi:four helix bundle protein [Roseimaritima sediminicola]|uniref:four helix bundle protein n=1 Tax=Roseimaritima sediminicola TaxID=2662066 RepID=UPI001298394E|nr:four helix bundle protein [Roseimaritima sediminicola]